jgi:K+-sensing histidine kinase KdpD
VSLAFLVLRAELSVSFGQRPLLIIFMFPIILSALLGGFGPGVVATLVAAIGIDYLAILPEGTLSIAKSHDLIQWLVSPCDTTVECCLCHSIRIHCAAKCQIFAPRLLQRLQGFRVLEMLDTLLKFFAQRAKGGFEQRGMDFDEPIGFCIGA